MAMQHVGVGGVCVGPLNATLEARDVASLLHPYTNAFEHIERGPLIITRGHGVYVTDAHGRDYIEGISGLWCVSLGFGEAELIDAAVRQMHKLPFYHPAMHRSVDVVIELAEKLKGIAPGRFSKVFLVGSGSEANETQIKLIRYYNNAIGRPEKKKIISRVGAYHGSTIATASLNGLGSTHQAFDLPLPFVRHTACPDYYHGCEPGESEGEFVDRLARELEQLVLAEDPDTVAAFIAEPVMGAGGVIVPPAGYFEAIQTVLRRYDIRFIVDEVICGFGRTGNLWGSETFGIQADSLSCAKALSSGYMPIGAVLIDEPMYEAILAQSRTIGTFSHGFTFGGHPTAAAVALRTIELLGQRDIVSHVRRVSAPFGRRLDALRDHPLVGHTRASGLLGAVELVADKTRRIPFDASRGVGAYCAQCCQGHGLIVRPLGNTVAFCPPLIITEAEIEEMFDRFTRALSDTHDWARGWQ